MTFSDYNQTGKSDQQLVMEGSSLQVSVDGVIVGTAWVGGPIKTHTYRIGGANCSADSMGECLRRLADSLAGPS